MGEGLKKIYKAKLLPLEEAYEFHEFISPPLNEPDFDAKPMIMFVGQYSTGKTSLIRYLLEKDYPGLRIGPEPTTDCFNAGMLKYFEMWKKVFRDLKIQICKKNFIEIFLQLFHPGLNQRSSENK